MEPLQHTPKGSTSTRGRTTRCRRLPPRTCLRLGCGKEFQPRRWNQWYCQDPECLREVRRWQAVRRQRKRRATDQGRRQHAQAEYERRQRRRAEARASPVEKSSAPGVQPGAWSRSNDIPENFCSRPGCYEPVESSQRTPSRYCSDDCRQAVRRAEDRKRKWRRRKTEAGRDSRQLEYDRARRRRQQGVPATPGRERAKPTGGPSTVRNYGPAGGTRLRWSSSPEEDRHDSKTRTDPRPRAPPAS
jgi:hypothetical protein